MVTMASVVAQHASDLGVQVVQRVFVFGEDDQLAKPTGCVFQFRCVLQDRRQLVPFAVQPGRDDSFRLCFQILRG